ncbi:putative PAS/PAC sensor protein [Caldithrix abyssi DSM 13497]|uniref:histidine kinase n=3 Tax=Caldithrix abyssi TaxID=187145 RepID=H1XTB9_CALAY|nr:putative PAS/PAC sensor protein [Caldithrix abyssi DSM 13497]
MENSVLMTIEIRSMKSLRYKIGLGYLFIILANIVMVVFVIYHIRQLSQPITQILSEKYRNVNAAENMKLALAQQEAAQFSMIEEGFDSTLYYNFNTYKNEFLNWHQRAIEGVALPEEPEILDSLMFAFRHYLADSDSLQKMLHGGFSYRQIKKFHYYVVFPQVKTIDSLCTVLKEVNLTAINEANLTAQKISRKTTSVIVLFSIFLIVISMVASLYLTRRIVRPIRQTTDTVKKIGRGQLDQKVAIDSDDEIGQLAAEFNKMTGRLAAYEKMNIEQIIVEKRKSEAIISSIPAAIIVTDANGSIILMNDVARGLFNLEKNDLSDKKITELINHQAITRLFSPDASKQKKEKSGLISLTLNNEVTFFEMRSIFVLDRHKHVQNVVILLQDVTSFKKLERLKSEFMATISHELKTPLTSLNMTIDILLRRVKGPLNQTQLDLLQGAQNDIKRLKAFVTELLEYSRIESGNYPLNLQSIEVEQLIAYAARPFLQSFSKKNITFKNTIRAPLKI